MSSLLADNSAKRGAISRDDFRRVASSLGFSMGPKDEEDYYMLVRNMENSVNFVNQLPEYIDPRLSPTVSPSNRTYSVPERGSNPLNAWYCKFELKDAQKTATGLLAGRSVAIKDTVSIAGIPFTCGTQPYHLCSDKEFPIPKIDSPVVTRILEAGGVIRGTATCENYCMSGVSFTSATGPVDNPWAKGFSAGGSSSGSAALVAIKLVKAWREKRGLPVEDLGEGVDFALGGDQGGSIRLPAAMSGVYGLKPTHGLVPYTGIASLHPLIDHCGPIAASISDLALLLTAIAGYDGMDPRMTPETPLRSSVPRYHTELADAIEERKSSGSWTSTAAGKGLRVGILKEAFELGELHQDVAAVVRRAAERFTALGGAVEEVSVPDHAHAMKLWTAVNQAQMADVFIRGRVPDLLSHGLAHVSPPQPSPAWYETMNTYNPAVVAALLSGEYLSDATLFPASVRAKALSHVHQLRAAYDAALEKFNVLVLPVTPCVGPPHAELTAGVLEKFNLALGMSGNTIPFNLTGHPGLSMPVGWAKAKDGSTMLPVGMQIVGKRWDEVGVLLAGSIWETVGFGLDDD